MRTDITTLSHLPAPLPLEFASLDADECSWDHDYTITKHQVIGSYPATYVWVVAGEENDSRETWIEGVYEAEADAEREKWAQALAADANYGNTVYFLINRFAEEYDPEAETPQEFVARMREHDILTAEARDHARLAS